VVSFQGVAHVMRLPQGELTFSGSEAKGFHLGFLLKGNSGLFPHWFH
jgi:hypothetical protein